MAAHGADAGEGLVHVAATDDGQARHAGDGRVGEVARKGEFPSSCTRRDWEAKAALQAGARMLVHSVIDAPVDDELSGSRSRAAQAYNPHPHRVRGTRPLGSAAEGERRDPAGVDPGRCVGAATGDPPARPPPGTARRQPPGAARAGGAYGKADGAENLLRVHEAGIPVAMGTDAGNTLTLHGASVLPEMEAMEAAGLTHRGARRLHPDRGPCDGKGRRARDGGGRKERRPGRARADPTRDIAAVRTRIAVVRSGWLHGVAELAVE